MNRVIHAVWLGGPLPEDYRANLDKLRELNPHWRFRLWSERNIAGTLRNRGAFVNARSIVPEDSVFQFMSDVARLEILHRHGGVYVDTDYLWQYPLEALPALDELDDDDSPTQVVTCWEQQGRYVANGFIAANAGAPPLGDAIAALPEYVRKRRGMRANRITGPSGLWTDLCTSRGLSVTIIDQEWLHPVPWNHPEWVRERSYPDSVAVHSWGHQRELRRMR